MNTCPKCGISHDKKGKFCSRTCANSRTWTDDDKQKKRESALNWWNTLDSEQRVLLSDQRRTQMNDVIHIPKCYRKNYIVTESTKQKLRYSRIGKSTITPTGRKKLANLAKVRNLGGHTSKRKLKYVLLDGSYVYLQSGYEIKYATFLDDNNIRWNRPPPLNWVDDEGIEHKYYPDFYLLDYNVFVDTKNDYLIIKDAEKISRVVEQNKVVIKVLSQRELEWIPNISPLM